MNSTDLEMRHGKGTTIPLAFVSLVATLVNKAQSEKIILAYMH